MATQNAQQEIKALKKDINAIKELLVETVEEKTPANGNGGAPSLNMEHLQELAYDAGRNARQFYASKRKQAMEIADEGKEAVQAHPFKSAAIAFAGGALLSALISASRRHK